MTRRYFQVPIATSEVDLIDFVTSTVIVTSAICYFGSEVQEQHTGVLYLK